MSYILINYLNDDVMYIINSYKPNKWIKEFNKSTNKILKLREMYKKTKKRRRDGFNIIVNYWLLRHSLTKDKKSLKKLFKKRMKSIKILEQHNSKVKKKMKSIKSLEEYI